jgi:hypothetical protein
VPVVHAQAPWKHCWPPAHTSPQAPQFCGSVLTLVHAPLHAVIVAAHVGSHAPALHTLPIAQANPHPPQLAPSAERSTHWPLQRAGV